MSKQRSLLQKTHLPKNRETFCLLFLLGLAALTRLISLSTFPGGINQDEAYAAYEAWSLLHYGMDSHGYHNPVYLVTWGSGMSVLYSYLSMPFIAILGLTKLAIRLPQAILGTLTVLLAYELGKVIKNPRFGLLFAGLLAINPWHIMMSRWGIDCNLVIFFLMGGLLFFLKGLSQPRFLFAAAVFYGLSLYCYATIWIVLPTLLLLEFLYGIRLGNLLRTRHWIGAVIILGIFALPLLTFLLVNVGVLPEIQTPFFSIPKLLSMRNNEYSFSKIPENLYAFLKMVLAQTDGLSYNALPEFGLFYPFSLPFICYGLVCAIADFSKKEHTHSICFLFSILALLPTILLLSNVNINKSNSLYVPLIFFCAYGIDHLSQLVPLGKAAVLLAYSVSFAEFCGCYYSENSFFFYPELRETLQIAKQTAANSDIYVADSQYAVVLFELRYPTDEFLENVQYFYYPSPWLQAKSFGQWRFDVSAENLDPSAVYVCHRNNFDLQSALLDAGFSDFSAGDYLIFSCDPYL